MKKKVIRTDRAPERYFKEPYPARATVAAQLLFHIFIEVDCIAVKSE